MKMTLQRRLQPQLFYATLCVTIFTILLYITNTISTVQLPYIKSIPKTNSLSTIQKDGTNDNIKDKCIGVVKPKGTYCRKIYRPKYDDVERRKGMWQTEKLHKNESELAGRIFGMHAYYDDRPILNRSVIIRMFLSLTEKQREWLTKSKCYLWLDCIQNPIVVNNQVEGAINGIIPFVSDVKFTHYIASCEVPKSIIQDNQQVTITHVSLVGNDKLEGSCAKSRLYIPVTYPEKPKDFVHAFGMCEANGVSFGHYDDSYAPWLIEWFEANSIFGISEFNIYNATLTVSDNVQRVLDYYQRNGKLILHQNYTPIENADKFHRPSADVGMRIALNDCFYRNMYRYKYIVGIDLDEIIVPKLHDNYTAMLSYVEGHSNHRIPNYTASLRVQSSGFFQSFTGKDDPKVPSKYPLKTIQYIYAAGDEKHAKSFSNPRMCLAAYAHNCRKPITETPNVQLNPKLVRVHHYRNVCKLSIKKCQYLFKVKEKQTRMSDFVDLLYKKVSVVADKIGITL